MGRIPTKLLVTKFDFYRIVETEDSNQHCKRLVNKVSLALKHFQFKQLVFVTFTVIIEAMTFAKNKNRLLFCLMIFAISFGSSGCFIFKKKCDCPAFGKRTEKPVEKNS